jgi:hypothetical protein
MERDAFGREYTKFDIFNREIKAGDKVICAPFLELTVCDVVSITDTVDEQPVIILVKHSENNTQLVSMNGCDLCLVDGNKVFNEI